MGLSSGIFDFESHDGAFGAAMLDLGRGSRAEMFPCAWELVEASTAASSSRRCALLAHTRSFLRLSFHFALPLLLCSTLSTIGRNETPVAEVVRDILILPLCLCTYASSSLLTLLSLPEV